MKTVNQVIIAFLKDKGISYAHICRKLYGEEKGSKIATQNNFRQKLQKNDMSTQLLIDISDATGENLLALLDEEFISKKRKTKPYEQNEEPSFQMLIEKEIDKILKKRSR